MAESEEELKSLMMKFQTEGKHVQRITLFNYTIDGETVETVSDFIFGAPKSLQIVIAAMKFKDSYSLEGKL